MQRNGDEPPLGDCPFSVAARKEVR
jgi:hypothetical protein